MELLPIIYVSLAIFSVVAFATIITSFISYKIREKNNGNKKPYETEEDPANQNFMKRKIMDSDGKYHTVIADNKNSKKKIVKKDHSQRSNQKKKNEGLNKNTKRKTESRIKIINQNTNGQLPHLPVKVNTNIKKKEPKITNDNILNKYTDDKDEEFFSPKTSIKRTED